MTSHSKCTHLNGPTSRIRRVSWSRYDKGLKNAHVVYTPLETYLDACDTKQMSLPFGKDKTSTILDVTGRTDTNHIHKGFAGDYCYCSNGGCE